MIHIAALCHNVLIAHSDPLLCAGIAAALRERTDFCVFVDGVDIVSADSPWADVVIADLESGMMLADPVERASRRWLARARILVVTHSDREADIRRAVEAGIYGYLLVGGPLGELVEAVSAVGDGARYLGRSVAQRMADSMTRALLTARETDVLRQVIRGECNKEIARVLGIEVGTVKSHMTAILTKLGATSRTQAAGIAATRGLVDEPARRRPVAPARMQS